MAASWGRARSSPESGGQSPAGFGSAESAAGAEPWFSKLPKFPSRSEGAPGSRAWEGSAGKAGRGSGEETKLCGSGAGAAAAGGAIAQFYGFRTLFVIMFVFAVLGTLVSTWLVRNSGKKQQ